MPASPCKRWLMTAKASTRARPNREEGDFLSEVVEKAECGLLLDVNNNYVSPQNHGFHPYDYLNQIPPHRVGEIHIAGPPLNRV
jgi:uncharacterized protein (UPF0276 family)